MCVCVRDSNVVIFPTAQVALLLVVVFCSWPADVEVDCWLLSMVDCCCKSEVSGVIHVSLVDMLNF